MAFSIRRPVFKRNEESTYDRIIRVCLWLAIVALPWFLIPTTTDPLELNKSLLFYLLMLVGGVTWLMKFVVRREGNFVRTPYDIPLAVFIIISLLAAIFSLSPYHSFVGLSGYYSGTFVSLIFFAVFFLLLVNTLRREHFRRILNLILISGGIVALFNFLQVFSVFILPWDFARIASFNGVTNSPAAFTVYVAIIIILAVYRFLALRENNARHPLERGLVGVLALVGFFLLMTYDQPFGWLALMIGLLLFLVFLTAYAKHYPSISLILPTILIGLALIGLFVNTQALLRANLLGDIILPPAAGWKATVSIMASNPILGFGQETFQAAFAKFRPPLVNDTAVWSLRFLKSSNEWFQQIAAVGLVGVLALLAIVILHVRTMVRSVLGTPTDDPVWWQRLAVLGAGFLIVLAMFVLPFNFLLAFLFWLFLGLGIVASRDRDPSPAAKAARSTGTSFAASLSFSLAVVLGIVFVYFAARFWAADVKMAWANRSIQRQDNLQAIQQTLAESIELNPYEQSTYFDLAQNLLVQAQLAAQQENPDVESIRALISTSVAAGQSGVQAFPKYAGSYEAQARLYRDIDVLTGTTSEATLAAHTTATDLEPNNPQLWIDLGQYHLFTARLKASEAASKATDGTPDATLTAEATAALEKAKAAFEEADRKKTNFIDAKLNIALALRLLQRGDEAVKLLEELATSSPFNTDVLFNLAENYLIDERNDEALDVLTRVVRLFPGHSDAHFRLAQIYEERGETQKAVDELEIVKRLNPDNADVQKKLDELKS